VANVSALPITTPEDIQQELVAQVVSQVRWVDSVRAMVAQGVTTVVEIGPGNVLTGLIKRIAPEVRLINLRTVDDIRSFSLAQS
jgi:[acyl-carrier-protein] S-malonyltransferase